MSGEETDRQRQARRDLERLESERERMLHASPSDIDLNDPVEVLGRRIARVLGPLLAAGLLLYLLATYLPRQ
jgi:hypothetical protein